MSKDKEKDKKKRVEIVDKYKAKGYLYCVHTIRLNSTSVCFYKTYNAAIRCLKRKLENPKNLMSTIFYLSSDKMYDNILITATETF